MTKATLKGIVNDALEMCNSEKNVNRVIDIKTKTIEELGKTVTYITATAENKHCFGKGKGYWKTSKFESKFIFIEDTHELLDMHWQPIYG